MNNTKPTTTIETGGPAFPVELTHDGSTVWTAMGTEMCIGLTIRDYFAARALPALIAEMGPAKAAIEAYLYADAMLSARNGKEADNG